MGDADQVARQPVYSTRFTGFEVNESTVIWHVPAGYIAVVRDIAGVCTGSTTPPSIYVATLSDNLPFYFYVGGETVSYFHEECRAVIPEGDAISLNASGGAAFIGSISGYLLGAP